MATKKVSEKTITKNLDENTLVEIELFRDNKDYKDNVFVAVNGESCVIARGKKVKVKKKFADVIYQSMRQDIKTARLMDNKSDEFYAEAAQRNM
ncbi:MAG: hypothetical protein IJD91_05450 [Clostridia bacterium]|nr:hypothetical protein [Clostridia bacterium]